MKYIFYFILFQKQRDTLYLKNGSFNSLVCFSGSVLCVNVCLTNPCVLTVAHFVSGYNELLAKF
jgi:hypothetical protein